MRRRRLFFGGCKGRLQKQRQHNDLPAVGSNFTQTIAFISAAGLVISSAGFGAVYAWTAGAPHGALMASLMVVMAVALECAKPLAVASAFSAFRSWSVVRGLALGLLATVAVTYSLTADMTLMATTRGDLVAERAATTKMAKSADGQRGRIEGELAKLSVTRPAATVRADIAGMLADPRVGDCSVMDGPRSKVACPTVNKLRAELGMAERREKLEADLAELRPTSPTSMATDKPADPGAHALSVYLSAIGLSVPAGLLTDWLTLVPVMALEIGAALSALLVQAIGAQQTMPVIEQTSERPAQTQSDQPQSVKNREKPAQTEPDPDPTPRGKRTQKRTTKRTHRNAKRRLGNVVRLVQASGGKVTTSQQSLARQLRLSKTRVNELLRELEASGRVKLHTSRAGTTVALAAA